MPKAIEVREVNKTFRLPHEHRTTFKEYFLHPFRRVDYEHNKALVDVILDAAEQKGTGRWTVKSALDLGIPVTGIAEAVFARALSGSRRQRAARSVHRPGRGKARREQPWYALLSWPGCSDEHRAPTRG